MFACWINSFFDISFLFVFVSLNCKGGKKAHLGTQCVRRQTRHTMRGLVDEFQARRTSSIETESFSSSKMCFCSL